MQYEPIGCMSPTCFDGSRTREFNDGTWTGLVLPGDAFYGVPFGEERQLSGILVVKPHVGRVSPQAAVRVRSSKLVARYINDVIDHHLVQHTCLSRDRHMPMVRLDGV